MAAARSKRSIDGCGAVETLVRVAGKLLEGAWLAPLGGMFIARAAVLTLAVLAGSARADDTVVHGELDPITFASSGYGVQLGVRPAALVHVRLAIDSFALDVPDFAGQLGGNDGFHVHVRPSVVVYAFYYLAPAGNDGFFGGLSTRYLRWHYTHDGAPGQSTNVDEISPEVVVGYQWHPFHNGFYVQPLASAGVVLWHHGSRTVGSFAFDQLAVSPFATVNLGWELRL